MIGALYYIKGKCRAQMKKHLQYEVDICMSNEGEMMGSSCECPVGFSEEAHCKHVIVLLLAIIDMYNKKEMIIEETCTQILQTFHRPSKKFNGSPMKACKFQRRIAKPYSRHIYYEKEEYNTFFRNHIVANSFGTTMSIKQCIEPANLIAVHWDHGFYTIDNIANTLLKSFHLTEINQEIINKIQSETVEQRLSKLWHYYRSSRLTASFFYSCCSSRLNKSKGEALAQKIINPSRIKSRAMRHGLIYESQALIEFTQHYHLENNVQKCGLLVSLERPYIGASPDGLLFNDAVIEIKCPYVSRDKPINEVTVPYLHLDENGFLTLKKTHKYYYQIQGQLYASKRKRCVFIVFTFTEFITIIIERDQLFIDNMLIKLDSFYNQYLKPAIISKFLFKNYSDVFIK